MSGEKVNDDKYQEKLEENLIQTINYSNIKEDKNNTNLAIISDSRASIYCILDLENKRVAKASAIEVPIRTIVITDRVKKLNK